MTSLLWSMSAEAKRNLTPACFCLAEGHCSNAQCTIQGQSSTNIDRNNVLTKETFYNENNGKGRALYSDILLTYI